MNPDEKYSVDLNGFLLDDTQWDREFAESSAKLVEIHGGLTKEHWDVINHIRETHADLGRCPLVFDTCRTCGLGRKDLKRLFPTGYLRGACRLAGVTYREGYLSQASMPVTADDVNVISANKAYTVDVRGFLIDPNEWDEYYAAFRAYDMKIPGGRLTDDHWRIVNYLRASFARTEKVPTVYETCEANEIDLEELEKLFPDGYQRGAVKLAGLRVI